MYSKAETFIVPIGHTSGVVPMFYLVTALLTKTDLSLLVKQNEKYEYFSL